MSLLSIWNTTSGCCVADGEKALFLRNEGDDKYPHLEVFREVHEGQSCHPRPGHRPAGTNARRQQRPPQRKFRRPTGTVSRRRASQRTWRTVSTRWAHHHKFKKIVLVAPPVVLGELRKDLHKEVADKVTAEVAKTLTNHTIDEIEKVLQAG